MGERLFALAATTYRRAGPSRCRATERRWGLSPQADAGTLDRALDVIRTDWTRPNTTPGSPHHARRWPAEVDRTVRRPSVPTSHDLVLGRYPRRRSLA
jgi:hypothetical protein